MRWQIKFIKNKTYLFLFEQSLTKEEKGGEKKGKLNIKVHFLGENY